MQDALDKLMQGRSVLVIAHRLRLLIPLATTHALTSLCSTFQLNLTFYYDSTVRNANVVCVIESGRIVEQVPSACFFTSMN